MDLLQIAPLLTRLRTPNKTSSRETNGPEADPTHLTSFSGGRAMAKSLLPGDLWVADVTLFSQRHQWLQRLIVLCWCFHWMALASTLLIKTSHKQSTLHYRFADAKTVRSLAGPWSRFG